MTDDEMKSLITSLGAINTSLRVIAARLDALEAKAHEHPIPMSNPAGVHPEIGTMDSPNYCSYLAHLR